MAAAELHAQATVRTTRGIGVVQAREYSPEGMLDNAIPDNAFAGAALLREIILPDNITSIGAGAFSGCDRLESVVIYSLDIAHVGEGAFPDRDGLTITVQTDGAKARVEGDRGFSHTKVMVLHPTGVAQAGAGNIDLSAGPGGMLTVSNGGREGSDVRVYDMSGRLVAGGTAVAMGAYAVRLDAGTYVVTVGGKPYKITVKQ